MKRYWLLGLVFILAMTVLTGCHSNDSKQASTEKQLPKLVIGCDDYNPYTYIDDDGNYVGVDTEIAIEACKRIGYQPEFVLIKWDEKDTLLKQGKIDCIWSGYSMNNREEKYTWVGPYMYGRHMVVVRKDSEIYSLKDLNGKSVAVESSTQPESILLQHTKTDIPVVGDVYCFKNTDIMFAALRKEYVDAIAAQEMVIHQYMEEMPGEYRLLNESVLNTNLGVAFFKNSHLDVAQKLTKALDSMKEDGTLRTIMKKYGIDLNNALKGGDGIDT